MNYYNKAFENAVSADPSFVNSINQAAGALGGNPLPSFDVLYFPKSDKVRFGTTHVQAKGFDYSKHVTAVIVLLGKGSPTTGSGSLNDLTAMMHWAGIFNAASPDTPCLLSSVIKNDMVLIFVQTTEQSNYLSGEIDFAIEQAHAYNLNGKPGAILCSLGGFGFLQAIKTPDDASKFFRAVFVAPGGNGNVGAQFPAAAAAGKLECLFYHNNTDPVALVAQSVKMNDGIVKAGGKSNLVLWDNVTKDGKPVHDVTFPLNAFFPWPSYNDKDHKLLKPGSYIPTESIYSFLCADQGEPAPVPDVLLGSMVVAVGDQSLRVQLHKNEQGYYLLDGIMQVYFEKP
jgi:hypothetical protein